MQQLIKLYLVFTKIGLVSFGGGYAMLPFIEQEVIDTYAWLTSEEFLQVLAISQITPGPIAINSATFVGYRHLAFVGAIMATLGIITAPLILMALLTKFLNVYKESKVMDNIFYYLRPITVALIFSAFLSTAKKSIISTGDIIIFVVSFCVLISKKVHPIFVIFVFGVIGIVMQYVGAGNLL